MKGKRILIGVTGSIAAYKAASLIRLFMKEGAEVRVIMTELAKQFIAPLTLSTLAKSPVLVDFFNPENGDWNSHVDLGLWADVYIIAPATANTIAKMSTGVADNLLLTSYLSAKCPIFVAPAMDLDMYSHPATQRNIASLRAIGTNIIEAESGELASGLIGKGRMAEPETILASLKTHFESPFAGKQVLLTAGPTYEKIDPVRFIGNFSSGKMGYALAETLAQQGAEVTLVSGPTNLEISNPRIKKIATTSAKEMYRECLQIFPSCDIAIMCAAVADFTPIQYTDSKIKSDKDLLTLELEKTNDIAAALGKQKKAHQILVGFALETDHERQNAVKKLVSKKLDFIVLNSLNDAGAGFGTDTNKISILTAKGDETSFELKDKKLVAEDIVRFLRNRFVETSVSIYEI